MRTITLLVLLLLHLPACSHGGAGEPALDKDDYDVVLLGGRVMDPETGYDQIANVGIIGDRIVAITTEDIDGKEVVDVSGLVVAPGFIDTHIHGSDSVFMKMALADGVTSAMDLEAGVLNAADWYAAQEGKRTINYGATVSQEMARMVVHDGLVIDQGTDANSLFDLRGESGEDGLLGWSVTVSTMEQMNTITAILDENLRQGAIGVGSTVGYASVGIGTYELFEAQRAAARYGRLTGVHTRFHVQNRPPTEATIGFAEIYTNASVLGAPLLYCHNNDYGWWEIEEKMSLAREQGANMWGEYYPFEAGSTNIGADGLKPAVIEDMLGLKYKDILFDPVQDKFLDKDEYLQVAAEDPGRIIVAYNPNRVEWMNFWVKMPHMTVASDSMWQAERVYDWDDDFTELLTHPRASGTHSRALRVARENDVPLMFTLQQLSYWSALHLGDTGLEFMKQRGRMQVGMVADITIFDAATVAEQCDYSSGKNTLPPVGIPHVLIAGQFVKRDGVIHRKMVGQAIRFPVEEEGRFEPVTHRDWQATFTIDTSALNFDH